MFGGLTVLLCSALFVCCPDATLQTWVLFRTLAQFSNLLVSECRSVSRVSYSVSSYAGLKNSHFELPALQNPPSILYLARWGCCLPLEPSLSLHWQHAGRERSALQALQLMPSQGRGGSPDSPLSLHLHNTGVGADFRTPRLVSPEIVQAGAIHYVWLGVVYCPKDFVMVWCSSLGSLIRESRLFL